jgi:hypothetical protein
MNLPRLRLIIYVGFILSFFLPGLLGLLAFGASGVVYVAASILMRKPRHPRDPYSVPDAIHPR